MKCSIPSQNKTQQRVHGMRIAWYILYIFNTRYDSLRKEGTALPCREAIVQHSPWKKWGIKGRKKLLHSTVSMGCNYLSLPLIPAPGRQVLIVHTSRPFCCGWALSNFTHFLHGYFTGTAKSYNTPGARKVTLVNMASTLLKFIRTYIITKIIPFVHIITYTVISRPDYLSR